MRLKFGGANALKSAVLAAAALVVIRYCFIDNWPDQVLYSAMSAVSGDYTVYRDGYNERLFRSLRVGMTERQVETIMGPPLRRGLWGDYSAGKQPREGEAWEYTRPNKVMGDYKIRAIWFDNGVVVRIKNSYLFD